MATNYLTFQRVALVLGPVLLAGCAGDPPLGQVVQHNIVAQAVDMEPQYAGVLVEGGDGQRTVDAMKRYKDGKVKPLYPSTGARGPQ